MTKNEDAQAKIALQTERIRGILDSVTINGYKNVSAMSTLGLRRSTFYNLRKGGHKKGGLGARLVVQMLAQPGLPRTTRARIVEYIHEKLLGIYGHNLTQRRWFAVQLVRHGIDQKEAGWTLSLRSNENGEDHQVSQEEAERLSRGGQSVR